MELQFHKTVVPCLHSISREMQIQEQTQEVRLTDEMPDIGKVLASWGQLLVRTKEWRSGSVGVSGGVMAWVLYTPEGGGVPQSIETWMPFQMKWEIPDTQRDGTINVTPILRCVDARSLSARKLMVRAGIGMDGEALVPSEVEIFSPGEVPEDVQLLRNYYPMQIPREAGEKAFALEETVGLPSSVPGIRKLIRYTLQPSLAEMKVVTDKLVIRGVTNLHILYLGIDDQLHSWDFEIPFSQYAELDKEYDSTATARVTFAVTVLELEQGEEENLNLKAGITAQYVIYERPVIEVVSDMYSPRRAVQPQVESLQMPALLDCRTEHIHAEQSIDMEGASVADVVFYPDHPQVHKDGDNVHAEINGVFQILCHDDDGNLQSAVSRWQDNWEMGASADARVRMSVQSGSCPQAAIGGGRANMRGELLVEISATDLGGVPMVTGAEIGEIAEPEAGRPSIILRRTDGESLWDMAKATGSTVDAIKKANSLQNEPEYGQLLLIPVS